MRASAIISATVGALVGFGGTVALVVAAAHAVGATVAQTNSWVTALCLAIAATSLFLSLRHRMPIITAWSTPGLALIAATGGAVTLKPAIGAFLLAAVLTILTSAVRPLAALVARIPPAIAAAMLAGILTHFVVAMFDHATTEPLLVLPLAVFFLTARLFSPAGAILGVLLVGIAMSWTLGFASAISLPSSLFVLTPSLPTFEPAVLIGLGLPLYLVTMASQNLAGFAVLRASGYSPPAQSILAATGIASLLTAPFGAHQSNLAAISAAICTGPDAHPDPAKRWQTGPVYAGFYLVFAAFSVSLVAVISGMPPALVSTIAGLALLGPLVNALGAALAQPERRFAAALTFAIATSGMTVASVGSAFWGLLAGLGALGLDSARRRFDQRRAGSA